MEDFAYGGIIEGDEWSREYSHYLHWEKNWVNL